MSELEALLIEYKNYYPCVNLHTVSKNWHCGIDKAPNISREERTDKNRIHAYANTPMEAFLKAISMLEGDKND